MSNQNRWFNERLDVLRGVTTIGRDTINDQLNDRIRRAWRKDTDPVSDVETSTPAAGNDKKGDK